ncbi:MAG: outer membrane protein assembly factor [Magnetococcales bacterium]|nr:outer membrane protein assembly factor [Magnetococcales bacterium]
METHHREFRQQPMFHNGCILTLCRFFFRAGCFYLTITVAMAAEPVPKPEFKPFHYDVAFEITGEQGVRSLLERVSLTYRERGDAVPSLATLRSQATRDRKRILKALRSQGYFAASVSHTTDMSQRLLQGPQGRQVADTSLPQGEQDRHVAASPFHEIPVHVLFAVETGPLYKFGSRVLHLQGGDDTYQPPSPEDLGLIQGDPAQSRKVLQADKGLLLHAQNHGYPFAALLPRHIVVDHATHDMQVNLYLNPGPHARMGKTTWVGLAGIKADFVQHQLLWSEGEPFASDKLERTRNELLKSGLFAMVDLKHAPSLDPDGSLPVTITVQERLPRTFSFGTGITSDQGPKVTLGWEHRNLLGEGEDLAAQLDYDRVRKRLKGNLGKPHFGRKDQSLLLEFITESENVEAYRKNSVAIQGGLERKYPEGWRLSLGTSYRLTELFQGDSTVPDGTGTFGLISFPFKATLDRSDDLLNPTRGWRLNGFLAPLLDTLENGHSFTKIYLQATGYQTIIDSPRLVLAERIKSGILVGSRRSEVPIDERFYTGGNGSLRGYAYQLAGPLDSNNKPLGGRSLVESSVEARLMVREDLELVLFLDEGATMQSPWPDFADRPYFGAGSGLRYLTPIGPLRLDVAVPLDRRSGVDKNYQISASIGQAF